MMIPSMPTKFIRSCITTDKANGLIFVIGGRDESTVEVPYLQILNLTNNQWLSWLQIQQHPFRIYYSMACHFDDNQQLLYTFGGYGYLESLKEWKYLDQISIYDMTSNQWSNMSNQSLSYVSSMCLKQISSNTHKQLQSRQR